MTYPELKEKYGEKLISLVTTEAVLAGLRNLKGAYSEEDPFESRCRAALADINSGSWDEIRSTFKRSL